MKRMTGLGAALVVAMTVTSCGGGGGGDDPGPGGGPTTPPTLSECDTSAAPSGDAAAAPDGAGGLMKAEQIDAPAGVNGWSIEYCSTGRDGTIIPVTGMLAIPDGDVPEGGWPVVAWAHGTAGLGDQCAPSVEGIDKIIYLEPWIEAGYAVAASDYQGLGTEGTPAYLIGESEARGVLDSVRAARNFSPDIGDKTVTVGYSQGGHSALWTGQLAASYAPDVEILGVVSLSGPTDLVTLAELRFTEVDAFDAISEVITSWSDYYGEDPAALVTPQGAEVLDLVRDECAGGKIQQAQGPLDNFLTEPLLDNAMWVSLLEENSTGAEPSSGQVFMAQAQRDNLVPADSTRAGLPIMCQANDNLRYQEYPVTHGGLRIAAGRDMLDFIADRFAGETSDIGEACQDAG